MSLVAPYGDDLERIEAFSPLSPVATTNFIGSRLLEENVRAIAPVPGMHLLTEDSRRILLDGLNDTAPVQVLDKIWEIIWERWRWYEAL